MPLLIHLILPQNQTSLFLMIFFNGWFGIPFQDTLFFAHIRSPHFSEILTLYGLASLIPFYPTILYSTQIRLLILHILSFRPIKHIIHTFLSHIVSPAILSSQINQCIINCFTFQSLYPLRISRTVPIN